MRDPIDASEHPPRLASYTPERCSSCGVEIPFREGVYTCEEGDCTTFDSAMDVINAVARRASANDAAALWRAVGMAKSAFRSVMQEARTQ